MSDEQQPPQETRDAPIRQAPWRSQAQATTLVLASVVIVAVIGALYLAQASRTAAAGRTLQELEAYREELELQNAQLRAEIAYLRSVPRLQQEAEAMGFRQARASEVYYMTVDSLPTPPQPTATPPPEPAVDVPAYNETLQSWLFERLSALRDRIDND
ncbi:MAG: hypothetical protein GYB64_06220 [Chloroflexi bacterium]|nr:hypothetical protein [Chloroflexota bacterium]